MQRHIRQELGSRDKTNITVRVSHLSSGFNQFIQIMPGVRSLAFKRSKVKIRRHRIGHLLSRFLTGDHMGRHICQHDMMKEGKQMEAKASL